MDNLSVKFEFLEKLVRRLRKSGAQANTDVSFEFIVGSCFPDALENMKLALRTEYTKGYLDGQKENQDETQNCNVITSTYPGSSNL